MGFLSELFIAVGLDIVLGDPAWLPHPVQFIGRLITALEKFLCQQIKNEAVAGVWLGSLTVLISAGIAWGLSCLHPWVRIYFMYVALAPRCLMNEALAVQRVLKRGDLSAARQQLSRVVGRDTASLSTADIIRATVETVAENTADGVIAPLFYLLLGLPWGLSVPFVWAFKAASTLDSMVGYKNRRYFYLGRFSARMDDVLSYLPARITGLLLPVAALLCWQDAGLAWRILWRDHGKHASPNSGWSEAAMAGALRIRLGGGAYYQGKWVDSPTLGEALRLPKPRDITRACCLMWAVYGLQLVLGTVLMRRWL